MEWRRSQRRSTPARTEPMSLIESRPALIASIRRETALAGLTSDTSAIWQFSAAYEEVTRMRKICRRRRQRNDLIAVAFQTLFLEDRERLSVHRCLDLHLARPYGPRGVIHSVSVVMGCAVFELQPLGALRRRRIAFLQTVGDPHGLFVAVHGHRRRVIVLRTTGRHTRLRSEWPFRICGYGKSLDRDIAIRLGIARWLWESAREFLRTRDVEFGLNIVVTGGFVGDPRPTCVPTTA